MNKKLTYTLGWGTLLFLLALCTQATAAGVQYSMQFEKAATSLLLDIAAAGQRLVAVGERGHILYSEDGGDSWTQAVVPTTAMLTRVFFVDEQSGWAVGHDGNILYSRDGGVNWELQRDGLADQVRINEDRAGRAAQKVKQLRQSLSQAGDEDAQDLQEALDEAEWALGNAREAMDSAIYAPPLMDVWFATPDLGWASGAYGTLLRTSNGGRHWQDWAHKLDNPDELHLNGVAGDANGNLFLASEWGTVFYSPNGGQTWEVGDTGYEGSFFGVLVNPGSGSIFAYGLRGTVYRSGDRGVSWEESASGVKASLLGATVTEDSTLVFVGQGGTVTRTADDGATFQTMIQPVRNNLHGVTPRDETTLIAAGDGGSRVLVTSNPANQARAAQ